MKLPESHLSFSDLLNEFDIWITPFLSEVQDTERFQREMDAIVHVFDELAVATNQFANPDSLDIEAIAQEFVTAINKESSTQAEHLLTSLASSLFLVTGKSDNNSKCQFPLFLRDIARWNNLPGVRGRKNLTVVQDEIPRVLKAEQFMKRIVKLSMRPDLQVKLLGGFINFILADDSHSSQLWSIGHSYVLLKAMGRERDLLAPLIVFQVRGSVSASGGHDPEEILRGHLEDWGLERGTDFNLTDVVVEDVVGQTNNKTRAYDFVLPYKSKGWSDWPSNRLFVQCQFYAGDSGSVSHKNVDQARTSRQSVSAEAANPLFIEFVDGAGYFSSLNGDLKKLLSMDDTHTFFQVRSACIRLRRALQEIGFLTPLEIEHTICMSDGTTESVVARLQNDGYSQTHIRNQITKAIERGIIQQTKNKLEIKVTRLPLIRRYLLLDVAAAHGETLNQNDSLGMFLIPGYGAFYGLKLTELVKLARQIAPALDSQFANTDTFIADISWLRENLFAIFQ